MQVQARALNPPPRAVLLSGVFGLVGYLYYGLGLPGSEMLDSLPAGLRGLLVGFVWGLVPLLLVWVLSRWPGKAEAEGRT